MARGSNGQPNTDPYNLHTYIITFILSWVDSVGFKIQRSVVRTPPASGAQENFVSFSESKLLCCFAVGVPNPCVYTRTHENDHVRMLKILQSMPEFRGLWKHEKTQHAL